MCLTCAAHSSAPGHKALLGDPASQHPGCFSPAASMWAREHASRAAVDPAWLTVPSSTRPQHVEQAPARQEYGRSTPLSSAEGLGGRAAKLAEVRNVQRSGSGEWQEGRAPNCVRSGLQSGFLCQIPGSASSARGRQAWCACLRPTACIWRQPTPPPCTPGRAPHTPPPFSFNPAPASRMYWSSGQSMVVSSPLGPTNVTLKLSAAATSRPPLRAAQAPLPPGRRARPAPWMRAGADAAAPGAVSGRRRARWPAGSVAGRLRAQTAAAIAAAALAAARG